MIPKQHVVKLYLRSFSSISKGDIRGYLNDHIRHADEHPNDAQAVENVRAICLHIFPRVTRGAPASSVDTAKAAFSALIKFSPHKDPCFMGDLETASKCSLPGNEFSIQTLTALGTLLSGLSFHSLTPKYAPQRWGAGPGLLLTFDRIIHNVLKPFKTVGGRLEALKCIFGQQFERADTPETQSVLNASIQQVMQNLESDPARGSDGSAYADLALLGPSATSYRNIIDQMCVTRDVEDV